MNPIMRGGNVTDPFPALDASCKDETHRRKRWIMRGGNATDPFPALDASYKDETHRRMGKRLQVDPAVIGILMRRGFADADALDTYLAPNLRHLVSPDGWPRLEETAKTVFKAIGEGREVLVWGDYDVDGVTASVLCYEVLRHHNVPVTVHLPERRTEGYGLNAGKLRAIAADGKSRVLVTVDCGINDGGAVDVARSLGMTVVVTDHHMPPERLPDADSVYDPQLTPECPCTHLAGVGVAFFLMARLNQLLVSRSGRPAKDMREVLDLVSLGTLADMVGLQGQNRILAKNGLLKAAEALRPGLAELKVVSGYERAERLGAGQIVFSLAPRLNAAGRVGSPMDAFHLLAGTEGQNARELARKLDKLNIDRRAEEDRIAQEAIRQAQVQFAGQPDMAGIVVYGADWHPGIIGIVASRLVEKYDRPSLVLCRLTDDGILKGSGRSVPDFDLHKGLSACADILEGYGGHRQAAGLSVREDRLDELRRRFHQVVSDARKNAIDKPMLEVDGIASFKVASDMTFLKTMELMQPFGVGNPEPVFVSNELVVKDVKFFGYDRGHATIRVLEPESGITMQAKQWRQAAAWDKVAKAIKDKKEPKVKLAFTVGLHSYNGITSVELVVKDWEFCKEA